MKFRGIDSPCKGCEKRHVLCHSTCEDFAKYKEEHESALRAWRAGKTIDGVINQLNYESSKKARSQDTPEPLKHGRKRKK